MNAAAIRRALLRRVGAAWRGPLHCVVHTRPWRAILVGAIVSIIALVVTGASDVWLAFLEFYGVAGLAIALSGDSVSADRERERWTMLFQRPGSARAHYHRVAVLSAATLVSLVCVVGFAAWVVRAPSLPPLDAASVTIGTALLGLSIYLCGLAASALLQRRDVALTAALVLAPFALSIVGGGSARSLAARHALEALMPPVNAVVGVQQAVENRSLARWRTEWTLQLLIYFLVYATVVEWRLRSLESAEVSPARSDGG